MKLKNFMALILCFAMVFSTISFNVFAAESITVTDAETLKTALTANNTVVLGENIEIKQTIEIPANVEVVLDLNGKKITSGYQENFGENTDTPKHIYPFDIEGAMTIKDSMDSGSISGRGIYVQNGAKLTVESGTIYGIDPNGGSALYQNGGNIFIKGGLIEQTANYTYNYAVYAGGGTITVDGGKVVGKHGALSVSGANATMNNGELICTGNEGWTDNVVYVSGGSFIMTGGTILHKGQEANADSGAGVVAADNVVTIDISGGSITGLNGALSGNSNTTVTGGTFIHGAYGTNHYSDVSSYVPEGYEYDSTIGTVVKASPNGNDFTGYTNETSIWGEVWGNAKESFVIKILDADSNVMGTTSLNNINGIIDGDVTATWNIKLDAESNTDEYWTMEWITPPSLTNVPARVELWIDGEKVSGGNIVLNSPDDLYPVFAAKTDKDGNILSYIRRLYTDDVSSVLASEISSGDNIAILKAGTYSVPTGKNCTITGAVDSVVFKGSDTNIGMNSASVIFNSVTFDWPAHGWPYHGLAHCGDMVYNDCTFNGTVFLYGPSETFNRCTFNVTGDTYNVWTYGAKEVEFNKCTFNSDGKSVLIYSEDVNLFNDVTVNECEFKAAKAVDGKAAIEMDSSLTAGINLTIDAATTATGFGAGNVSGNSLWNNKKGNEGANNDITVTVNNLVVLAPVPEIELPTATVTKIENNDLTFALNFKADEASDEQLEYYGDWYADFVLTVNKDVTFNANGGANGYLSGQYDKWSENWVNVPFENVTLKAGEPLKIMEYAAKFMNQSGLKLTYNDVYSFVKDFDCGVFFEEDFLAENPDLKVTLELRMYNNEDESENYAIGETYNFEIDEPEDLRMFSLASAYVDYLPISLYPDNIKLYRLGLYSAAESMDYDEYGFEVTVDGQEPVMIKAEKYDGEIMLRVGTDRIDNLKPGDFDYNGSNNVCIFGQTIAFDESAVGEGKVKFRPYVVIDGKTYWGYTFTSPNIYTK